MTVVIVFLPVYVNGKWAGWEGRRYCDEDGAVLQDIVRETNAFHMSGLLTTQERVFEWWKEGEQAQSQRRVAEEQAKIDAELREANQLAPFQAGTLRRNVSREG